MKILGISGLENSVPFKRRQWPGLEEREYRISQGHDSAAAIVIDGNIVAAAGQERFTRKKHTGEFPGEAIQYCLQEAGIQIGELDEIAHGFDYAPYWEIYDLDPVSSAMYKQVFSRESLLQQLSRCFPGFPDSRVFPVGHHLAHAASAYYTSGWNECLVIVNDAMGEIQGVSIYQGREGKLKKLREIPASDSIGILYSLVTLHLGFDFNSDEYKIMGLAPYGDPARFRAFFEQAVEFRPDGTIRIPMLRLNTTREARENYLASRDYLSRNLIPAAAPGEITDAHRDVAAALQECLDRTLLHICREFSNRTGLRNLALAGGVSLNCTANGHLMRAGIFDEVYVQPVASDDGTALGAALHRASLAGETRNRRFPIPFFGPEYSAECIQQAITAFDGRIHHRHFDTVQAVCDEAARRIAAGQVIGWFQGRMEYGPRALGNRSILADPGHPEMRDRINAMVKKREAFRPFAPAVACEEASKWFDLGSGAELPYMISIVNVRPEHRAALTAVTHVNGSARVQTVSAQAHPVFHALLQAVGRTTGRKMVLNTSFNVKGQPIVNTPQEAIETFVGTTMDCLFMGPYLVWR